MAEIDWEKIRAEYIAGKVSCRELGEKYHVSPNVVSKKATKDGWRNDRRKCGEKVAENLISRSARARTDAALKGLDLVKYTMDIWNDNLRALNETIKATPEYMLSNPSFASGIAKGLKTTYDLLMQMSGDGEAQRRTQLEIQREKLEIEKQKIALEKQRLELELENARKMGAGGTVWEIIEDPEGANDG